MRSPAFLLIVLAAIGAASFVAGDGGRTVGLLRHDEGTFAGYTLLAVPEPFLVPNVAGSADSLSVSLLSTTPLSGRLTLRLRSQAIDEPGDKL
ncbi:MAG: hypothetical protein IH865_09380 [Chloroflexi bacterium]|nr:hypothetical protein [Chloroflexota bacterium]